MVLIFSMVTNLFLGNILFRLKRKLFVFPNWLLEIISRLYLTHSGQNAAPFVI